jgi:outer membrane protein
MKNISLLINVVLGIAVVVLYYLHFSDGKSGSQPSGPAKDLTIAYINSDTVLKYFDYAKDAREKLEAKGKQLDQDLNARATSLQGEFESYQRNVNNMTIGQAKAVESDLTQKRNNLQLYQDNLSQQMLVEQERMNRELYERVTSFMRRYSEQNGIQVVLKFNPVSDLLYANNVMDISSEVIKGLNEEYRIEKQSQKPATKDTVAKAKKK